jgi:hypothetical protein
LTGSNQKDRNDSAHPNCPLPEAEKLSGLSAQLSSKRWVKGEEHIKRIIMRSKKLNKTFEHESRPLLRILEKPREQFGGTAKRRDSNFGEATRAI